MAGNSRSASGDSVVVCVVLATEEPEESAVRQALATIERVQECTDAAIPVVVAGARSAIDSIMQALGTDRLAEPIEGAIVEAPEGPGEVVNAAIRATSPADVVLLAPGVGVHPEWLTQLRSAALSDTSIASASPLFRGDAMAARAIAGGSLKLRPKLATIGPDCVYLRRGALDLANPASASDTLQQALARAAPQLISLGMVHVAADDVMLNSPPASGAPSSPQASIDALQDTEMQRVLSEDPRGALRRARRSGAVALRPISVTIDGRSLTSTVGGTQTYALGLITALAQTQRVTMRVLVPPDLSERAAAALSASPEVELLSTEQTLDGVPRTDVVHRPQQAFNPEDLALLRLLGERLVLTHQDLIAYHNHSYHPDLESWRRHREVTRLALDEAEQVVFFSEHARRDALTEDLLTERSAHVVSIGREPLEPASGAGSQPASGANSQRADGAGSQPAGVDSGEPFLLCLGADYAHKNRPFAIELLCALDELGWSGRLVLAGPHVPYGSSRDRERLLLEAHPRIAQRVCDLGPVDEPTKRWLCANTRALLYPTLYEGFGLLPLEAAHWRVPCIFAAVTSLVELAGEAATLLPWDAKASAARVLPLLIDGAARDAHLATLAQLHAPTWDEVAQQLLAIYELAATGPPSIAASLRERDLQSYVTLAQELRYHRDLAKEYHDLYCSLQDRVSAGLPLIGDDGLLSPEQQLGLMRVASRRITRTILLPPLGLLGSIRPRRRPRR